MLDKAFELYPYNSSALDLEQYILKEWRRREPQNPHFISHLMINKIKGLEITLGQMRFQDHLLLSRKQIETMYRTLDKQASDLYTEIDLIKKSSLKVETNSLIKQINEIHVEARKVAGIDR